MRALKICLVLLRLLLALPFCLLGFALALIWHATAQGWDVYEILGEQHSG